MKAKSWRQVAREPAKVFGALRYSVTRPSFLTIRAVIGTLIVVGGIASAVVTYLARRAGADETSRFAALLSLAFVLLMLVFVVPPLVRAARAEVGRMDAGVSVTRGGVIFVGLVAIVVFAAWNTGNNLLFIVFSILVATLFVSWAAGRAALAGLSVAARFPDHIFAGQPAGVFVTVRNAKRMLPSVSIVVEASTNVNPLLLETNMRARRAARGARKNFTKRPLAYFVHVPSRAQTEQRAETVFDRRGRITINGFEISTGFPFGFFRFARRLRTRPVELIVYPQPEPAGDELHLLPMSAGRLASVRRGQGHELYGLRDYRTQDDLRHIDWKTTARVRRLTVREFTAEDERRVHIMFDTRPHSDSSDEERKNFLQRFERGVTLAASLVAHFTNEGAEVILTLGDEAGERGVGREHFYHSLRRLALISPADWSGTEEHREQQHLPSAPPLNSSVAPFNADDYRILLTTAAPGSIPAHIWRTSHVIYL